MLDEAVHELRGEPVVHEVDPELIFDADALLPEDYVADVGVRLSLYKRFASAPAAEDVDDLAARDGGSLRPAAARGAPLRPPDAPQDRAPEAPRPRLRGDAKGVTLHLRDDTPLDPTEDFEARPGRSARRTSSRPT